MANIPTSSTARHSEIYPNRDVWFENMPSGNPDSAAPNNQRWPFIFADFQR
jgi:hypothetical protein